MHCILIGVTPLGPEDELWKNVTQRVSEVGGLNVNWISSSTAYDEGRPTQLLCARSDAPVEDIVSATSLCLGDLGYSCELWASAPAILPLRPLDYGGYKKHLTHNKDDPASSEDWANSTMQEWGMFMQTKLIDRHEIEVLRGCVNQEIANVEELLRLHRPEIKIGKDGISFKEIASRGNERFDLLLEPTSKARDFVEHAIIGRISLFIEHMLDGRMNEDIDFDISVVYSKPGAPNQGWHADGEHQKGATDAGWLVDGWKTQLAKPYALCLFIPLVDLDDATGFTQFWPRSHRNRGLMGFGPVAEIAEAAWDGKCKAGDAIWYDYRLMHRGMGNSSTLLRPVIQLLFKKKWYTERRNYGTDSIRQILPNE